MKKILTVIWSIIKFIIWVLVIGLLIIIGVQRITKNEKAVAGFRIFTVITESMVPVYKVGDSIVIKNEDPSQLKVGDDITYLGKEESMKDKIVTHRIISIEKNEDGTYKIQTKGVANDEPDPIINESQVYGKVLYKIKTITFINGIAGNLYGMYFAIFLPFGLMVFLEFVVFRKLDEKDDEDEDDEEEKKLKDKKEIKKEKNKEENKKEKSKSNNEKEEKKEYTDNEERQARKEKRNKKRSRRRRR